MSRAAPSRAWPVRLAWLTLVGATLAGVMMAEGLVAPKIAATLAFMLAAIKIRVVFAQYMELAWCHQPLRTLLELWLVLVTLMLIGTYWLT